MLSYLEFGAYSLNFKLLVSVILGTKQLKYYLKFMKMTGIDLIYTKKTFKFYIKDIGIYTFYWTPRYIS